MRALLQLRLLLVISWLGAAAAIAAPVLQTLTSVVNLTVPASAFDPATGNAEVTLTRGLVLQVTSSSNWKLRLRTLASTFTYNGASNSKPATDLQLRDSGGKILVPTRSFVQIANGGNTHGAMEYAFDVILQADSSDTGGLYSVKLEFDLR